MQPWFASPRFLMMRLLGVRGIFHAQASEGLALGVYDLVADLQLNEVAVI
jgi:hypothetical protein